MKSIPENLKQNLSGRFTFDHVSNLDECLQYLRKSKVPLLFLETGPGQNAEGLEAVRRIRDVIQPGEIVIIAEDRHPDLALQAIQNGAFDCLSRSDSPIQFSSVVDRALDRHERSTEINRLHIDFSSQIDEAEVYLGNSPVLRKIINTVERIAPLPTTVLLQGESGTGKEVVARLIHQKSHLHRQPFVAVSLPSIPNNLIESVLFGHEKGAFTSAHRRHYGKFELADTGTIFLDEIGDLPIEVQSKLLRVIQEGEIERIGGSHPIPIQVRLIAASKFDLRIAVKEGRFRDDLFYRLNVVPLHLPPLRQLTDDIPSFVDLFIRRYADRFSKPIRAIQPEALHLLQTYHWPGNIRELENLIERIIAMSDGTEEVIRKEDVPLEYYFSNMAERSPTNMTLDKAMEQYERNLISKTLRLHNWNRKKTAEAMGVTYGILKYKIRKLKIKIPGE